MGCALVQILPIVVADVQQPYLSSLLLLLEQTLLVPAGFPTFLAKLEAIVIIAIVPLQYLLECLTLILNFLSPFYSLTSLSPTYSPSNTYPDLLPSCTII